MNAFPVRTAAMLALNVLLLLLLAWRLHAGATNHEALETAMGTLDIELRLDALPAGEDLSAMRARPLFHATRQFVEPQAPRLLRPAPPDYRFAGAMIVPDSAPVAYLRHARSGASVKVRAGEVLDGWTVLAIESRRVILEHEGERIDIGSSLSPAGSGLSVVPMASRAASATREANGIRVLTAPAVDAQRPAVLPTPSQPAMNPESAGSTARRPRTYRPPPSN